MVHSRLSSKLAAATVVCVVAIGPAAQVASAHVFQSESRTRHFRYEDKKFKGRVKSPRPACESRKVVIKKVVDGRNRVVGSDETNDEGKFRVRKPNARGRYYAKVRGKANGSYGHSHICRAARSDTIRVR